MRDEKLIVIKVLRALLISRTKNGSVSLNDLKREYCIQEGKEEIPIFEYKNAGDFLHSSGEFILNVCNGEVMVREKPKSESLHIKKFVMEQKSGKNKSRVTFRRLRNINHKTLPAHVAKPTVVFNFDELYTSLNNANTIPTSSMNSRDEMKSQSDRIVTSVQEGKSTASICFDSSKGQEPRSFCDASTMIDNCELGTDLDARLRLFESMLPFNVVKDCHGEYCAIISIKVSGSKKVYFGYGSSVDEAKSDALQNAMKCRKQKNEQDVLAKPTTDDGESSTSSKTSFYLLNEMTNVQYHCHRIDGFYLSSITVEGREYNALGVSEASAKDKAAEKVFDDKEIMLLIKIKSSNEWKFAGIVNGLHKVTVKIDEIIYDGEGYNPVNAVTNCIENALKMKPGTLPDTNQTTSFFKILTDRCVGLNHKIINCNSDCNYKVMLQLDGGSYYGKGLNVPEANENAAECFKAVLNGKH